MIGRLLERLLSALLPLRKEAAQDWEQDADWARQDQGLLRARALLYSGGIILILLLVWAAYAELDEVTRGEGRVIPSRQIQLIQAVDGGVVSEILVREGQLVDSDQLLLRIDPTRFISSFRENHGQYLALAIKAERLKALSEKRAFALSGELAEEAPDIAEREERLYQSTLKELDAQVEIARQQLKQRDEELKETITNRNQLTGRLELLQQELDVTGPMVKTGAVSQMELLRLERDVIQTRGERDQVISQADRIQSSIAEATRKIQEVKLTFYNRIRRELSETLANLNSLTEEKTTLADRVKHADVKSPVRGTVKRLFVNTLGAVVQQGEEVIQIIPADDTLVLEVKVSPKDIAFLVPGQKAQVRFTAYDYAVYGGLEAIVDRIGADTIVDDKGNAFYMVRVRTLKPELGENLPIIPGMMAQTDIITGKKTILAYLLKPILQTGANALKER
jgi:membrane fusion protein, adhesin transport system